MFRRRILELATHVAKSGPGVGKHNNFRLGAALVDKKGRVVNTKTNLYRTHPLLAQFTDWPCLHAESHCVIANGIDNCYGLDLYVCRVLRNGSYGSSKPCSVCQQVMEMAGIRNVWYTTGIDDQVESYRVY